MPNATGDIWAWHNLIDNPASVLSAIPAADNELVLSNIRDPRVGKLFRANLPGGTDGEIRIAFSGLTEIGIFGVFGANIEAMTSVTLRAGTLPGNGSAFDIPIDPAVYRYGQAIYIPKDPLTGIATPVMVTDLTIRFTTIDAPFQCGRVWAGPIDWAPPVNHAINTSTWQTFDFSARSATPRSGAILIDRAKRRRAFTAAYDALGDDDYSRAIFALDNEVGQSAQVLFVPDPAVYEIQKWPVLGYVRELEENRFVGFLRAARTISVVESG
jgi:hypothetical protein